MSKTRFQDACGNMGKFVAARLLPGSDLIEGIEEICKKNSIQHAYVSCFGSLAKAGYMYLVPNEKVKMGAGYGDVKECEGPVEFLSGTGVVCQNNGKYDIHFHAVLCNDKGEVFGGHIVKGKNPTLTTVDIVIFEADGIKMLRKYDDETELIQFYPAIE